MWSHFNDENTSRTAEFISVTGAALVGTWMPNLAELGCRLKNNPGVIVL